MHEPEQGVHLDRGGQGGGVHEQSCPGWGWGRSQAQAA